MSSVDANITIDKAAFAIHAKAVKAIVNAAGKAMAATTSVTPFRKGQLRQDRKVTPNANGATMRWQAPHAAVQDAGRRAGARPFTNYTTGGTGSGFVEKTLSGLPQRIMEEFNKS